MTREERFNMDMIDEFKHMCEIVEKGGRIIVNKQRMLKALYQKPKIGRWELNQYDYNPNLGNWHCSECKCIVVECVDKNEKGGIPLYKYCPQCGAKMEV